MVRHYSRPGPVSSEKHEMAAEAGVEEGKGEVGSILTATVVVGGYRSRLDPNEVLSHAAKVAKTLRSKTPAILYSCETLLQGLAQHLEHVATELRPFIQQEHPMVRPRHLARHRHVAPADQPCIRDGVVGGATRAGRD